MMTARVEKMFAHGAVAVGVMIMLTAQLGIGAEGTDETSAVVLSEFINDSTPYPQCHASTIVEIKPGTLATAWFGGTHERHPDVGIWFALYENGRWRDAVEVATGIQPDGTRYPTWNPVLFRPLGGRPILFYKVGANPRSWWGMWMTSPDDGRTWQRPRRLPDGVLGPIKNKPVILPDGAWLSASSSESAELGWRVHFELSHDNGRTWNVTGPVDRGIVPDAIQPSILFHRDGRLQALCRTKQGIIATTWSSDEGRTWSPLAETTLPNPNSGIDAVTLDDGRELLVYNHAGLSSTKSSKGPRYPLDVAISLDGATWKRVLTLETAPRQSGYAYPAVIQTSDGLVHVTYTWDRRKIKHVVLDPKRL